MEQGAGLWTWDDLSGGLHPQPVIGLVVALQAEARSLLGQQNWQEIGGRLTRLDRLADGTALLCVCSGIGFTNARTAAQWLIEKGVRILVGMGVAGGLDPSLKAGDLVIADAILEEHRDQSGGIWYADTPCVEHAQASLAGEGLCVRRGAVITCHQAVLGVARKGALFRKHQALAVDMESTGVAVAAGKARLPFFILRAVCDPAGRSVSKAIADCLTPGGEVRRIALLLALLRQPALILEVLRMRKDFLAATRSLGRAWHQQLKYHLCKALPP